MKRYGPCIIKHQDEFGDEYTNIMYPVEAMMGEYCLISEVEALLAKRDEDIAILKRELKRLKTIRRGVK